MDLYQVYKSLPENYVYEDVFSFVADDWNEHIALVQEKIVRCLIQTIYSSFPDIYKGNLLDLPVYTNTWMFTSFTEGGSNRSFFENDYPTKRHSDEDVFYETVISQIFGIDGWSCTLFETRGREYLELCYEEEPLDQDNFFEIYLELAEFFLTDHPTALMSAIMDVAFTDSESDYGRTCFVVSNSRLPKVLSFFHGIEDIPSFLGKDYLYWQRLQEVCRQFQHDICEATISCNDVSDTAMYWFFAPRNCDESYEGVSFFNGASPRFYITPLLINQCLDILEPYIEKEV